LCTDWVGIFKQHSVGDVGKYFVAEVIKKYKVSSFSALEELTLYCS